MTYYNVLKLLSVSYIYCTYVLLFLTIWSYGSSKIYRHTSVLGNALVIAVTTTEFYPLHCWQRSRVLRISEIDNPVCEAFAELCPFDSVLYQRFSECRFPSTRTLQVRSQFTKEAELEGETFDLKSIKTTRMMTIDSDTDTYLEAYDDGRDEQRCGGEKKE